MKVLAYHRDSGFNIFEFKSLAEADDYYSGSDWVTIDDIEVIPSEIITIVEENLDYDD